MSELAAALGAPGRGFNGIDALLALIVLLGLWQGWRRGFLVGTGELLTLLASVLAAFWWAPALGAWLEARGWVPPPWAAPLAFVLILAAVGLLFGVLLRRLWLALPPAVHRHPLNRLLGLLPGAGNGLINAAIVALLLLSLPIAAGLTRLAQESVFSAALSQPAAWAEARLGPIFEPALDRTLAKRTVEPGSADSEPLPFKVDDPKPRPELEARMLELVNEERRKEGIAPLQADAEAREVARAHARDMLARGYFSHVTPDGKDPFDRMNAARLPFRSAGENLALAPSLELAHEHLMESPGHRRNILRPGFGRVGIGVLDAGRHGLMVTQTFRN